MNILAIDTSSNACSIALLFNHEVTAIHQLLPMQQAQTILPLLDELLQSKNVRLNQLDALAFGCGPGSFTGVRIATSVIQGLGFSHQLPVIPISSLAALAQSAYMDLKFEKCWVAIDARISEVYWGRYQVQDNQLVTLIGTECVSKPEEMILTDASDWYGVGDGWEVYKNQIPWQPLAVDSTRLPMAKGILALAIPQFEKQAWVKAADAIPVYLRDNVAKKSKDQSK